MPFRNTKKSHVLDIAFFRCLSLDIVQFTMLFNTHLWTTFLQYGLLTAYFLQSGNITFSGEFQSCQDLFFRKISFFKNLDIGQFYSSATICAFQFQFTCGTYPIEQNSSSKLPMTPYAYRLKNKFLAPKWLFLKTNFCYQNGYS